MRMRTTVIVLLATLLASCGDGTVTVDPGPEAPAPVAGETVLLRYGYADGESLDYRFIMDLDQTMTMQGDGMGPGGFPGQVTGDMQMTGSIGLTSRDLDDGNRQVGFSMTFGSMTGEYVAGGERIDLSDPALAGDFSAIPMEYEMVIDERGEIVELLVNDGAIDVGGILEMLGGDTSAVTGAGTESLLGIPSFPEGEVAVGTTWKVDASQEFAGRRLEASTTYEITAIDGNLATVESVTRTGAFSITARDLFAVLEQMTSDELAGTFGAPIGADELDEMLDMLDFTMEMGETFAVGTVEFDVARGITLAAETGMIQDISMTMSMPDPSGETMKMEMDISQSVGFAIALVEGASA